MVLTTLKCSKQAPNQKRIDLIGDGKCSDLIFRKSYRAVVWLSAVLTDDMCRSVSSSDPFEIQQLTPIRVLHRRTLLSRPRSIYRLSLSPINAHFALLEMETQAGTYIKEFVHGDRGRTQPNLGSLLSCQADIIQLDVMDLHQNN